jgi:uncharacterized protein YkwD
VTRLGTLIAAATPLVVWAAIGGSASAAVAYDASAPHGARSHPAAAHAAAHAHQTPANGRGKASGCATTPTSSRAKHRVACRATSRRSTHRNTVHSLRLQRPHLTSSKPAPVAGALTGASGTIAKVLATPCQNTQLIPEAGNLALVRAAVLCLINTKRAQSGEEPLTADPRLEQAAESHGKEMLSLDYFDHISPSGVTPVQRIRTTGYIPNSEVGYVIGENLAWGTLTLASPQSIVSAWLASPEHLANILESKYRDTGIDIQPEVPDELSEGTAGALYTQEFGVIVH